MSFKRSVLMLVCLTMAVFVYGEEKKGCVDCHRLIAETWEIAPHAGSMDNEAEKTRMNQPGCAHCHTAQGYWREILEKKESAAPYKDAKGITCIACHTPHQAPDQPSVLRAGKVEAACTGCHDILVQNDEKGFSSCPQGTIVQSGGGHSNIPKNCAGCHMAGPSTGAAGKVGGHTFRVFTKNQKDEVMNPLGCKGCHESISLEWVRAYQEKTKKRLQELAGLLPQRTGKVADPWEKPKFPKDPSLNKVEAMASFNYYTIWKDGTWGVHNPTYIKKLLDDSIKALKTK